MSDDKKVAAPTATENYVITLGSYGRSERQADGTYDQGRYDRGDTVALSAGEAKALTGRIAKPGTDEAKEAVAWKEGAAAGSRT